MDSLTASIESPETEDVNALLMRHLELMRSSSPEDSCHVMTPENLLDESVVLMGVRKGKQLLSVGGIKQLDSGHGELKSMHTRAEGRGQGAAQYLLTALLGRAREMGMERVSLETGSAEMFFPAQRLYVTNGFALCPPFGDYEYDPLSLFMSRKI